MCSSAHTPYILHPTTRPYKGDKRSISCRSSSTFLFFCARFFIFFSRGCARHINSIVTTSNPATPSLKNAVDSITTVVISFIVCRNNTIPHNRAVFLSSIFVTSSHHVNCGIVGLNKLSRVYPSPSACSSLQTPSVI